MDDLDRKILALLQQDFSQTTAQIADHIGLSVSACAKRIARLKKDGVITRVVAKLDANHFPKPVVAAVMVTLCTPKTSISRKFVELVKGIDAVQQCHIVNGDFDYLLIVKTASTESYLELAEENFGSNRDVHMYKTHFILRSDKQEDSVPDFCLFS